MKIPPIYFWQLKTAAAPDESVERKSLRQALNLLVQDWETNLCCDACDQPATTILMANANIAMIACTAHADEWNAINSPEPGAAKGATT